MEEREAGAARHRARPRAGGGLLGFCELMASEALWGTTDIPRVSPYCYCD